MSFLCPVRTITPSSTRTRRVDDSFLFSSVTVWTIWSCEFLVMFMEQGWSGKLHMYYLLSVSRELGNAWCLNSEVFFYYSWSRYTGLYGWFHVLTIYCNTVLIWFNLPLAISVSFVQRSVLVHDSALSDSTLGDKSVQPTNGNDQKYISSPSLKHFIVYIVCCLCIMLLVCVEVRIISFGSLTGNNAVLLFM